MNRDNCLSGKRAKQYDANLSTNPHVDMKLLAREMNSLTVDERNRLYEEIHGVADTIEETQELLETSLREMKDQLANHISRRQRRSLDRAYFLKPNLVRDDDFHLIFLRAEHFDPVKAAAKMARHFLHKEELWGADKLVKRITMEDLGEKEMEHMHQGSMETVVINERGLQANYFMIAANKDISDWKAFTRYQWYQIMTTVTEDEEAQKMGNVAIASFHGPWHFPISELFQWNSKAIHIGQDWPVKLRGLHYCYDSRALDHIMKTILLLAGKKYRLHLRTHFSSPLETQYALMSYGIRLPEPAFKAGEGMHSKKRIQKYVEERKRIEEEFARKEEDQDGTLEKPFRHPRPDDVLMGRGRPCRDWPGNHRLFQIVSDHTNAYIGAKQRIDKTILALIVVNLVEEAGNFMERTDNGWVIVQESVAKEKVSQLLRACARGKTTYSDNNPKAAALLPPDDDSDKTDGDGNLYKRARLS